MKVQVLGCGTSSGVPMVTGFWGSCDPQNPKNRRRRASIMLTMEDGYTLLVDTSPDLREQLLDADFERLDGIFYTHVHADHVHGIDDLRFLIQRQKSGVVEAYSTLDYVDVLEQRFDYIFKGISNYPPLLKCVVIEEGLNCFGNHDFDVFRQPHGNMPSLGFRTGDFAYSTDCVDLDDGHFARLEGLKVWIVDAVRYKTHPTHAHLDMVIDWVERIKPEMTYLTHMATDMDYQTLCETLPAYIRPAYDGLALSL